MPRTAILAAAVLALGCRPTPASPLMAAEPRQPATEPAPNEGLPVKITTTAELESATRDALSAVLRQHDVRRYVFTEDVVIDASAIPHSHPVLTLHARYVDDPDRLLLLFVHEQLHWYLERPNLQDGLAAAKAELAARYPDHPTKLPEGGFDGNSTLTHLVLCWLELEAGHQFLGAARTRAIFSKPHIYSWIYRTVLADRDVIAALVEKHGLALP
jgi:hypothetical protein